MSTDTTTDQTRSETGTTTDDGTEATFTQADLDRIIADRLKRENIGDLKAKAAKLEQLERDRMTADEKVSDRIAKLEAETAQAKAEALRLRIAGKHGVSAEDAELFLTGTDEETLTRQAQRLSERTKEQKRAGNVVPGEGKNTNTSQANDEIEAVRQIFRRE